MACSNNEITDLNFGELINLEKVFINDNKLSTINLEKLTKLEILQCSNNLLKSLNFNGLVNLRGIDCSHNQLTFLDVKKIKGLSTLVCNNNSLVSLDINGLSELIELYCSNNKMTTLNMEGLLNLTHLHCQLNELKSILVNESLNLESLDCSNNLLTTLLVNKLNKLVNLNCSFNSLSLLNVQGASLLFVLDCSNNSITSLNLSGCKVLANIYCNNNLLSFLDASENENGYSLNCNNNNLLYLICNNFYELEFNFNPNLAYICCKKNRIEHVRNLAILYGLSIIEINTYCSFTPGGKFYTLHGKTTYDDNNNGCDVQDIKWPYTKYKISNNNIPGSFISNSTGRYSIPLQEGNHTITPILENPSYFDVTPSSFTITFPSTTDTITQDFCITPKGVFRQTNITIIPLTPPARPGFDASYKIVWENVGNQLESGTLNFTFDETLLDYISFTQTADQIADGIIKWNFTNLLPFEKREITVTLKVNRPTDTPAVNAGDKLYLTASILDKIFILENTVVGSYDPNDKTCLQGDRVKPDMVGDYVDYLIRFENTGNFAAENVVVKDIIDTKTFNVSTLKITDASHEVYTRIEGNKVEFIFENINLPFDDANNDGYIAFKIKTLPSLVLGDSLKNLADIYFDYNFPIRTNEAQTTVAFPVFTKDITSEVNIYPNPVSEILYLDTVENWTKAEIFDITGRIMRSASLNGQSMDVSELESGTYFIRLKDGAKVGLVKFVKM